MEDRYQTAAEKLVAAMAENKRAEDELRTAEGRASATLGSVNHYKKELRTCCGANQRVRVFRVEEKNVIVRARFENGCEVTPEIEVC
jgi:hypothetical protein